MTIGDGAALIGVSLGVLTLAGAAGSAHWRIDRNEKDIGEIKNARAREAEVDQERSDLLQRVAVGVEHLQEDMKRVLRKLWNGTGDER